MKIVPFGSFIQFAGGEKWYLGLYRLFRAALICFCSALAAWFRLDFIRAPILFGFMVRPDTLEILRIIMDLGDWLGGLDNLQYPKLDAKNLTL